MNLIQTIEYRLDSNGNGSYDPEAATKTTHHEGVKSSNLSCWWKFRWNLQWIVRSPLIQKPLDTVYDNDTTYSGFDSQEGIQDDWVNVMDPTKSSVLKSRTNKPTTNLMIWDLQLSANWRYDI